MGWLVSKSIENFEDEREASIEKVNESLVKGTQPQRRIDR